MSKLYTIQEKTLTNITDAIRRKYNFNDKIKVTNIPLYISNDSSLFWVTHFNDNSGDLEGTGVIYTRDFDKEVPKRGWHYYVKFTPDEISPSYYSISDILDFGVSHYSTVTLPADYNHIFGTIVQSGGGYVEGSGLSQDDVTITFSCPAVQANSALAKNEVVGISTEYKITQINKPMITGALCVFGTVDAWKSGNPAWNCSMVLHPTLAGSNVFSVVKKFNYPIQAVRTKWGYDTNDETFDPIKIVKEKLPNEYTSNLSLTTAWEILYKDLIEPYHSTSSGDLILCANGWNNYPAFFTAPDDANSLDYDLTPPENGFTYVINFGNNYPAYGDARPDYTNPGAASMWNYIQSWHVGDNVMIENVNLKEKRIPTTTPTLLWYEDGYTCTSRCDLIKSNTITIDGNLLDHGWGQDGWYLVNKFNGTFQAGEPTNTVFANSQYMYKFRTDDKYLYVGVVRIFDNLSSSNDIESPHSVRLWINPDKDNAQIYSHFYDLQIDLADNTLATQAKHNTSSTANVPENITNTSLEAKASIDQHKVVFEFKVELAEFGGENGFAYFLDYAYDRTGNGFTLYAQDIAKSAANDYSNFPYNSWYKAGQGIVDLEEEEISSDEAISLIKEALL